MVFGEDAFTSQECARPLKRALTIMNVKPATVVADTESDVPDDGRAPAPKRPCVATRIEEHLKKTSPTIVGGQTVP